MSCNTSHMHMVYVYVKEQVGVSYVEELRPCTCMVDISLRLYQSSSGFLERISKYDLHCYFVICYIKHIESSEEDLGSRRTYCTVVCRTCANQEIHQPIVSSYHRSACCFSKRRRLQAQPRAFIFL